MEGDLDRQAHGHLEEDQTPFCGSQDFYMASFPSSSFALWLLLLAPSCLRVLRDCLLLLLKASTGFRETSLTTNWIFLLPRHAPAQTT